MGKGNFRGFLFVSLCDKTFSRMESILKGKNLLLGVGRFRILGWGWGRGGKV